MKDILIMETCEKCGGHLTLMGSVRIPDDTSWLVKRCLNCYARPVEEVEQLFQETHKKVKKIRTENDLDDFEGSNRC